MSTDDSSKGRGRKRRVIKKVVNIPEEFVGELLNAIHSGSFQRVAAEVKKLQETHSTVDITKVPLKYNKTIYEWACFTGNGALVEDMRACGYLAPRDEESLDACEKLYECSRRDQQECGVDGNSADDMLAEHPVPERIHDNPVSYGRMSVPIAELGRQSQKRTGVEKQSNSESPADGVQLDPRVSVSLATAIDTGSWQLTKLAFDDLIKYYEIEIGADVSHIQDLVQNGILADGQTIYEYACSKGHVLITQQFFRGNTGYDVSPADQKLLEICNEQLTSALQANAANASMVSMAQLSYTYLTVQTSRDKHTLAAQYYKVRHHYLLFLPATILTAVSAILAFLSTSFSGSSLQHVLSISVGVIATVSTLIQTISDQMGLSGKAEMHRTAAHELETIILSLEFSGLDSLKNGASFREADLNVVKKQVASVEASCSDSIPEMLHSVYNPLMSEVSFYFLEAMKVTDSEIFDADEALIGQRVLAIITKEITMSAGWPWRLSVRSVSEQVMAKFLAQYNVVAEMSDPCMVKGRKIANLAEAMKQHYSRTAAKVAPEKREDNV
jgi:hypothetical protein